MLKRTFLQGRINKDLDERTLPDGEYRDALNIEVINSEGSDVGAIENQLSNKKLTYLSLGANPKTIGKFEDESEDKIYWFVKSDSGCYLLEWDDINKVVSTVLEDTRTEDVSRVLNLKEDYLITGIQKVISEDTNEDLLMWTDDNIEPCCINIERAKTWGPNNFSEDDIYLMKKQPRFAPTATPTYSSEQSNFIEELFITFGYRYKYRDGERSAISSYTNYNFNPKKFGLDFQTMENLGMVNNFNAVRIGVDTGPEQVTDVEIIAKFSNSNALYLVANFNKEKEGWDHDVEKTYVFSNNKIYTILAEKELYRTFDNVPRKAKALELIENIPVLGNYLEGYDIKDADGNGIKLDYTLSLQSTDITEEELSTSISSGRFVITIPSGVELNKNNRLIFDLTLTEPTYDGAYTEIVEYLLPDDFANASELALDTDFKFFVEDILTAKFIAGFTFTEPVGWSLSSNSGFSIYASTATTITIAPITLNYMEDTTPHAVAYVFDADSEAFYSSLATFASIKTNRDYEAGIIYQDIRTRKSTVLAGNNNTIFIPQEYSVYQNKILMNINHPPPYWADTYKIAIKHAPLEYHIIYVNLFYKDGLYRWIKLEGANKDKVKEGDVLIVKSDLGGPVSTPIKVKVLEVAEKEKDFYYGGEEEGDEFIEEAGLYMKIKPSGFDMSFTETTALTFENTTHYRYPPQTFTSPEFGTDDGSFVPYAVGAGSTIRIYIEFKARGSIAYEAVYDKRFNASTSYDSIKEWFEAEVEDLGSFGREYTWDGVTNIWNSSPPPPEEGYGAGDANNKGSGWGFTTDGSQFFVRPHRKGTASRNITATVRFDVVFTEGLVIFETEPKRAETEIFYETAQTFEVISNQHQGNVQNQNTGTSTPAILELDFFNCYVQGNGVESFRVKDALNTNYLNIDLKPTSTSIEPYKEVRRFADLTYGEAFIESTNLNGLNVFNASQVNWKELDKQKGSIQKLISRDGNIVVLQEDKAGYVSYGQDLLSMANGDTVLAKVPQILGAYQPYQGENGVSKHPESVAMDAYRIYYVNQRKGTPIRLSIDGTSEINYGLVSHFRDLFINNPNSLKLGGFDPYHNRYALFSEDEELTTLNLYCGNIINKAITEEFEYVLNLNNLLGEVTISYDVSGGNVTIDAVFNSISNVVSNVTGTGTITFDRDTLAEDKVYITVTPVTESANVQLTNTCPAGTPMKIVSIVVNDSYDVGKTIINRFKRGSGTFYSDTHYFSTEPISKFTTEIGLEGVGKFPTSGETVTVQAFKDTYSTATFNASRLNTISYLVTDTVYDSGDISTILSAATDLTITNTELGGGSEIDSGSFTFTRSSEDDILYLIWDYSDKNEAPVAVNDSVSLNKGAAIDINVLGNDSDPDGDTMTPVIVSYPDYGTLVINPDKTIKYTHDDSENFEDSFTYKVSDGLEYSNVATVTLAVGVDCSGGITASGGVGIYEAIVVLGTDTGFAGITYNAISVPDRFQIEYDGVIVADSKYVGDGMTGSPPTYAGLIDSHTGLAVFSYNGTSFDATGETRDITVTAGDVSTEEPPEGNGVLTFEKTSATPTTMKIIVTAPVETTAWNFTGICPAP